MQLRTTSAEGYSEESFQPRCFQRNKPLRPSRFMCIFRGLAALLEIDGSFCDPVDIDCRHKEVVTEHVVREHNAVEDVLLRKRRNLGYMADLDAVAGNYGGVRTDSTPRDHSFR